MTGRVRSTTTRGGGGVRWTTTGGGGDARSTTTPGGIHHFGRRHSITGWRSVYPKAKINASGAGIRRHAKDG